MKGLNDIDEKIVNKEYLLEILALLDDKDQTSFYGFYLKYIKYSISLLKIKPDTINKLKKLLGILIKVKIYCLKNFI